MREKVKKKIIKGTIDEKNQESEKRKENKREWILYEAGVIIFVNLITLLNE